MVDKPQDARVAAITRRVRVYTGMAIAGGILAVLGVLLGVLGAIPGVAVAVPLLIGLSACVGGIFGRKLGLQWLERIHEEETQQQMPTPQRRSVDRAASQRLLRTWVHLGIATTASGIVVAIFSLAVIPPPWSALLIAYAVVGVASPWHMVWRLRTRQVRNGQD